MANQEDLETMAHWELRYNLITMNSRLESEFGCVMCVCCDRVNAAHLELTEIKENEATM